MTQFPREDRSAHPGFSTAAPASPAPVVAICAAGEIWGGVERFVLTAAERLRAGNMLAVVILFHDGLLRRRLSEIGVPTIVIERGRYDVRTIHDLQTALTDHRINVLHVHGYKAGILGGLAARFAGVKIVKTVHGRLEPGTGLGYLKMRANVVAEHLTAPALADAVAFVSADVKQHTDWAYPFADHRIIPNGIAPPAPGFGAIPPGIDPSKFNIGIVGRVTAIKGHEHLLQAMRLLPHLTNIRLHVVGDGPLLHSFVRACAADGLADRVQFHGFRDNVADYLRHFHLLVMPSLHEGLPYTLLEAMSLEVPVLASSVGGLAEALVHLQSGYLVPPRNAARLAAGIDELYRNDLLRRRIAANALQKLRTVYSLNTLVNQYADLYRLVLAG